MRRRRSGWLIVLVAVALGGCKEKIGQELAVVALATTATAVRVGDRVELADADPRRVDWEEIGAPVELDGAQRASLRDVLMDAGSYGEPDKCAIVPGIKVTFHGGDAEGTRLFLCFECGDLLILGDAGEDRRNFGPAYGRLAAWAKGVFPDDPAIQALGDRP